jgi:Spy/CpxP family protein refolding chaperone
MKIPTLLKSCAAVAVALVPLSLSFAEPPPPPGGGAGHPPHKMPNIDERLTRLKSALGLSDDQVAKLKTIFEDQKAAAEPIWKDASLSPEQKREKMKPIMQDTKAKIDAVLTPEQQAKFQELRKQHRGDKKPAQ